MHLLNFSSFTRTIYHYTNIVFVISNYFLIGTRWVRLRELYTFVSVADLEAANKLSTVNCCSVFLWMIKIAFWKDKKLKTDNYFGKSFLCLKNVDRDTTLRLIPCNFYCSFFHYPPVIYASSVILFLFSILAKVLQYQSMILVSFTNVAFLLNTYHICFLILIV